MQVFSRGLLGTGARDIRAQVVHTTLEGPLWRYPDCRVSADGEWIVLAGEAEAVIPRGVLSSDASFEPTPTKLKTSVGEAFDHFQHLVAPNAGHADHLKAHIARYGISLLCRDHGLPMFHQTPARSREAASSGRERPSGVSCLAGGPEDVGDIAGIRVEAAVSIAHFFHAVDDLAYTVRRGRAVARWHIRGVGIPGRNAPSTIQRISLAELQGDGRLNAERARSLVTHAAEGFLSQCTSNTGVSWIERRSPELVVKTKDCWGIYTLELIRRLSVGGEPRPLYQCPACGTAVQLSRPPRDGDSTYCEAESCRREKERLRKARQRARKRSRQ